MKQLIWIIVLFAIAIGLAMAAKTYSGNVFIVVEHYLLRINLHLFVIGLIASVFMLYLLIKLLVGVLATPERMSRFGKNRKSNKAAEALNAAGLAYFEGRYQEAEQAAAKVLANKEAGNNRILALMIGAHAADQSGNAELRNKYLTDISRLPEKQQLSRYLLLAESALNQQNEAEVDSNLKAAAQINPRLTRLVQLQLRQAVAQNNALEILDKTDKLRRAGAMNDAEQKGYTEHAYRSLLNMASDNDSMKLALKRIPDHIKNSTLNVEIAEKYESLGLYAQAVNWVDKHYPASRNAQLLPPFVESVRYLDEHAQRKAIDTADAWLKESPQDAKLLMHLGELAFGQQLWGKAQGYLEASLAIEPNNNAARLALAKVFDETGNTQSASEQRRLVLAQLNESDSETTVP
ncbi:heme biosynthesis HemY N-terminal domain-containing protein [Neisseriaceae bacterium B1]